MSDRAVKRMQKTIPSPLVQTYRVWPRTQIHTLIGEMMDIAKQRQAQIKGDACLAGSQLEKAVDRYEHRTINYHPINYRTVIFKGLRK